MEVAQTEDWPRVVEKQAFIDFLLREEDLREARQSIARKAELLRADGSIDAEQSACILIEATSTEELPVRPLTLQTLEGMGAILRAGSRLQNLREGVAWLEEVAKFSSPCVPSFSGGDPQSFGAAGTFLMERPLSSSFNAAVWRIGNGGCGAVDEDVVTSAHQLSATR